MAASVAAKGNNSSSPLRKAIDILDRLIADVEAGQPSKPIASGSDRRPAQEDPPAAPLTVAGPPAPPGGVLDKAKVPATTTVRPAPGPGFTAKNGGAGKPSPGAATGSTPPATEAEEVFNKAWLQVGRVASVEDHPVADKLLLCKVEIAPGEFRQVVAGLRKHIAKEKLLLLPVCLILNLKPAKLAGAVSEAMILAGERPVAEGTDPKDDVRTVRVLEPPPSASIGDRIFLEGGAPSENPAKQLSSKVWEKIVRRLCVKGGMAMYDIHALVTLNGPITVEGLPDGSGIH